MNSAFKINGLIAINKPVGISSAGALNFLKKVWFPKRENGIGSLDLSQQKILEAKNKEKYTGSKSQKLPWKVGHGGTLSYKAGAILGFSSDTLDIDGKITGKSEISHITEDEISNVIPKFKGEQIQIPPIYSALKLNGKPLYYYARSGKPLPIIDKKRSVHIHDIELDDVELVPSQGSNDTYDNTEIPNLGDQAKKMVELDNSLASFSKFHFSVSCSSGTYIRTLASDICSELGTHGLLYSLIRTKQGPFSIMENSVLELSDAHKTKHVLDLIEYSTFAHNSYFSKNR
ncbi:tRNA pseudouridine synthase 4 [Smittium culicis]|uniref:tRNA pseudouridine(55) synthase n=1 Tax=Smittium culicis TaxID=133412 RepID=A0A1R1WXV5_9FUNG|nr:tRNA pseudouridine synthase 4 [Smittium culicis]